jgi:hypothetical protein
VLASWFAYVVVQVGHIFLETEWMDVLLVLAPMLLLISCAWWLWTYLRRTVRADPSSRGGGEVAGDGSTATASSRLAGARWWSYLCATPVLVVMVTGLRDDTGRLGETSSASTAPMAALVVVLTGMSLLLGAVWSGSRFRYRSPVLVAQVAVVWVGGLLYGSGVRMTVTGWDLAEEVVLLVTTLLLLLPGRTRQPGNGQRSPARSA